MTTHVQIESLTFAEFLEIIEPINRKLDAIMEALNLRQPIVETKGMLLSRNEAAQMFQIHPQKLYNLSVKGELNHTLQGRKIIFDQKDIENYLTAAKSTKQAAQKVNNPGKHMHANSIAFLNELRKKYGSANIHTRTEAFKKIRRKYGIYELGKMLGRFEEKGFIKTIKDFGTRVETIVLL